MKYIFNIYIYIYIYIKNIRRQIYLDYRYITIYIYTRYPINMINKKNILNLKKN